MTPGRKARPTGAAPPPPAAPAPPTSPPPPPSSIRPPPGPPPPWLAKPSGPPLKRLNEQRQETPRVGFTNPNPSDGAFLSELQARCKQRRQHSTTDEEKEEDDVEAGSLKQEEVSNSGHLDTEVPPQSPTVVVVPGAIPMPPPPPPLDFLKTQKIPALKSHRLSTPVTLSSSKTSSQADMMAELMQNLAKRKSMTQESPSCSSTSTSAPNGSSTPQKSDFTGVAKLQLPWAPARLTKPKMILPDSSEEKEIEKHPEQPVNARDSKRHTVPANRNRRLTMPPLASHSTFTEKLEKEANEEEGSSVPTQRSFKDTLAMWNNKAEKAKPSVQSRFSLVLNRRETSRRPDSTATATIGEEDKKGGSVTNGSES
ncbi:hypothetical protein B9Z55_024878 [Caenorhabditis nigoni]|uniref:Uncharacterized protein n=1 Tax=Caenorhabditis nigoni TaxID=1611254 RepID=A0A2G5SWC1_9PELO|nr:hypothetical protein B9Z55_024878 [Caenorhabditis nigoni]